eukprot:g3760.t1
MKKHQRAIHWFRKGLRLHDNPALKEAADSSAFVFPVFVIDPWFASEDKVGINRYRFLLECLKDLDNSLRKVDSRLYVLRGKPEIVLPTVMKDWNIDLLTYERDTEPYAKIRDAKIDRLARGFDIEIRSHTSHTMFDPEHLFALSKGKVTTSYRAFQKLCSRAGAVPTPVKGVTNLGTLSKTKLPVGKFTVPSLEEMGYDVATLTKVAKKKSIASYFPGEGGADKGKTGGGFSSSYPFVGGESVALARLAHHMRRKKWMLTFEKPKTPPNSLEPSTTVLSPYLKFGCLSVRTFWYDLQNLYETSPKRSAPPVSMDGQLLWREFYYYVGSNTPNYDKMEGNPICRNIPWEDNSEHLEAWTNGRTGYPWIDAAMTQLREQGWIHHLARHAVACFLTRGDLWISWEKGARVFDRFLLDADWSLNNGNWMWLSASCFFYQYFRVYGPVSFGRKTDKDGAYIRKWIPKLAKFPSKYIYEPWKAPRAVQEAAGCVIGRDYPLPIVDHKTASQRNIGRMKAAYAKHKATAASAAKSGQKRKRA